MKKFIGSIIISLAAVGCFADGEERAPELECSLADHAKQYTVYYEYVDGNCGSELEPNLAYNTLMPVADCSIVAGHLSEDSCEYSFVEECREDDKVSRAFFTSVKQADGTMSGWVQFSGYPCTGTYNTTLVPVEN